MMVDSKKAPKRKREYKTVVLNSYYRKEQKAFTQWLDRLGYAESTIKAHYTRIAHFLKFLEDNYIENTATISFDDIKNYYELLSKKAISSGYLKLQVNTLERYCKYLEQLKSQKVYYRDLSVEKTIPVERNILTQKEIQLLFSSLENTPEGLLHRTLLHLYYSCGLRSSEGARVLPKHINYQAQLIYIVPGKNYEARYVPINTTVAKELKEYEQYARPLLNTESPYFLVTPNSDTMNNQTARRMLNKLLKKVTLPKHITLHCLRHSIATHLLSGGMDLESISRFLGHKTLDATQIYVRINNQMIYDTK